MIELVVGVGNEFLPILPIDEATFVSLPGNVYGVPVYAFVLDELLYLWPYPKLGMKVYWLEEVRGSEITEVGHVCA